MTVRAATASTDLLSALAHECIECNSNISMQVGDEKFKMNEDSLNGKYIGVAIFMIILALQM